MKNPPEGWPRISSVLFYDEPRAAVDFLSRAFGFEVRKLVAGRAERLEHAELVLPGAVVMIGETAGKGDEARKPWRERHQSPLKLSGANTQSLCVYVDDVDAHCERARANGAMVVREPQTDSHGESPIVDRVYGALDREGHLWWFMQRVRG